MPLAPELPTVAATPVEGPQDDLEKYLALPTESNFDLDVLAWWKARAHDKKADPATGRPEGLLTDDGMATRGLAAAAAAWHAAAAAAAAQPTKLLTL